MPVFVKTLHYCINQSIFIIKLKNRQVFKTPQNPSAVAEQAPIGDFSSQFNN